MPDDLQNKTICIIEAETDAGELLGEVFRRRGFRSVCVASNYQEAISILQAGQDEIWLVLLDDLYVSGKQVSFLGPHIISWLKENVQRPVALILMSAAMREDELRALQQGGNNIVQMHGYFRKPLLIEDLLRASEAALLHIAEYRSITANPNNGEDQMSVSMDAIRQVKQNHESEWMNLPGVTAVGIGLLGNGNPGIIINVNGEPSTFSEKIPEQIEGVAIEIRKSGEIRAF